MGYRGFPKYETVGEKRAKALRAIEALKKKKPNIQPVIIEGNKLVKTWWGKTWNKNLESYADYSNRIKRGKSYVKNFAVMDLKINKGEVFALVHGSSRKPYNVTIQIDTLSEDKWRKVTDLCNHRIGSLDQLLEGKFPKELEELFINHKYGFFPAPDEIHFDCSCPDWAYMCKHVAAVLYGIGSRLDEDPLLFFELRDIDSKVLIKKSMESKLENMLNNAGKKSSREINDDEVFDIFGV